MNDVFIPPRPDEIEEEPPGYDFKAPSPDELDVDQPIDPSLGSKAKSAFYSGIAGAASGVSAAGTGIERLGDIGSRPNSFRQHQREMEEVARNYYFLPPERSLPKAQEALDVAHEERRKYLMQPGTAIKEEFGKIASGAKEIAEENPGVPIVNKASELVGGFLPFIGVAAIPVVGPAAAVGFGGLQAQGATYDAALKSYKEQGLSEKDARRKADEVAFSTGLATGAIFKFLPGSGKAVAEKLFAKHLEQATPLMQTAVRTLSQSTEGSLVMAANSLATSANAKMAHNPDLTMKEAMESAAKDAVAGFAGTALVHVPIEAYGKVRSTLQERAENNRIDEAIKQDANLTALLNSSQWVIPGTEARAILPSETRNVTETGGQLDQPLIDRRTPQPQNRIRVNLKTKEPNASDQIIEPTSVEGKLPQISPRENVSANAPEIRQESGKRPDGISSPVGTTPVEATKPGEAEVLTGKQPSEMRRVGPLPEQEAFEAQQQLFGIVRKGEMGQAGLDAFNRGDQAAIEQINLKEKAARVEAVKFLQRFDTDQLLQLMAPENAIEIHRGELPAMRPRGGLDMAAVEWLRRKGHIKPGTEPEAGPSDALQLPPISPTSDIHGGAPKDLTPEQKAIQDANNSRAAFEALAKEKGVPLPEKPTVTSITDTSQFPIVQLPVKSLKLSKEVPNFKLNADVETGVVSGEQLEGKFEQLGTGPITVWQRANGDMEVVSGRHRLDLARRTKTETLAAQVLKESDGWTPEKVANLDAEMNIRDGQGTVSDYANFFKGSDITSQAATERGLLARAKGRAGYQLGRNASPDLYAAYRASRVSESQAVAIAESAPGQSELQQVGIKAALEGDKPEAIRGRMEAAQNASKGVEKSSQSDFFADTTLGETWKQQGTYVAARRKELTDIITTRKSVVNKYQAATGTGSIKATREKALKELTDAQSELERWQKWGEHPDLRSEVENLGKKPESVAPTKKAPAELLSAEEMPFNLERPKAEEKPVESTTGFGKETLAQQEMFAIQKIVADVDPEKSANAAEQMYGKEAVSKLRNQLSVVDSDKVTRKAFSKEQRGRLSEVIALLEQRKQSSSPAAEQKFRIGTNPSTYSLVERLPQSESEKVNNEQPVRVKNDRTGEIQDVMESDLVPVKTRTADEKVPKRNLDDELRAAGMEPSVFQNAEQKREALRRYRAKDRQASFAQPFYSRITRTIEQSPQGKASGAQWKATIKNSKLGVNADEVGLVGVNDLEDGRVYTKQEVLDYLKANEIVVKDVTLGQSDLQQRLNQEETDHQGGEPMFDVVDSSGRVRYTGGTDDSAQYIADDMRAGRIPAATHFSTYQLPGSKEGSYREVLLTVPGIEKNLTVKEKSLQDARVSTWTKVERPDGSHYFLDSEGRHLGDTIEDAQRTADQLAQAPRGWSSVETGSESPSWYDGHTQYSSIRNPIVRLRFNERTTSDGKRMLFLEEVQAPQKEQFEKMPALFQKNWREVAFKWALRHAAENGFDAVGWTTGEQQAHRYSLSRQVDKIIYGDATGSIHKRNKIEKFVVVHPKDGQAINLYIDADGTIKQHTGSGGTRFEGKRLEDVIGKDIASKIVNDKSGDDQELTGAGLEIGGVGLKKLYDVDLRNVVNNLPAVKKAGQKVGMATIGTGVARETYLVVEHPNAKPEHRWEVQTETGTHRFGTLNEANQYAKTLEVSDIHSLQLTPAIRESVMAGQPLASLGESESRPIREGSAVGVEASRTLISESGLSARTIQTAQALLDLPMMRDPFWNKMRLELRQTIESVGGVNPRGTRLGKLFQLSGTAEPDTLPHEVSHEIFDWLPKKYQDAIEKARVESLKEHFPDAPPEVVAGTMRSDRYMQASLPLEMYPYSRATEFTAHFFGEKFADEVWAKRNQGFWQELGGKIKDMVHALLDAIQRFRGKDPNMDRVYREMKAGTWTPKPESGAKAEAERELSLPRTVKEYGKQKEFDEPATPERTMAAYGDIVEMKRKAADAIEASDRARKMTMLTNQELLATLSSSDMAHERLTFGNYDAMRQRTEGSDMGLRSGVIIDAFRGMGYEQHRMLQLRDKLSKQEGVIKSKSFQDKLSRLFERKLNAETSKQVRETFQNQITQQAGDVVRELNAKGKTDAEYEQLRNTLARLQKMPDYNEAVAQRVDDIISVVSATEGGLNLLYQGGDRTGTDIARAYLDIKQSIAQNEAPPKGMGNWLSKFDRENYLSEGEKQRIESKLPVLTDDAKAFANLASQVLAANTELRMKLATLEYFRHNPEFQAQVTEVGERFRKQFVKDPSNAIGQIVKTATRLKAKEMNAEAAWLRLNKDVMPEIERYRDLQQAVEIDNRTQNSPEWKKLVNQILEDNSKLSPALRIPDSELKHVGPETVFNEFTGRQQLRSPLGNTYDVDLGFTKSSVTESQSLMQAFLGDVSKWLADPANADSPDRNYWNMRYDFVDAAMNVSSTLSPTASYAVFGIKSPWGMIEFLFKGTKLPASKIASTASVNFQRAWAVADQWFQGVAPEWRTLLIKAAKSHDYDAKFDIKQYREEVLDRLASEYRHGKALKAGDRLNNGVILTKEDLQAFRYQGGAINKLFSTVRNVGREKVMTEGLLLDEWAKNVFGIRAPQELGAEPGTTLPHEFSSRAKALASRVNDIHDTKALVDLFNQENVFKSFVQRFIAERRADYSDVTPFEDAYKQLAEKWRNGETDAPNSISEIVDYIEANTGGEYTREGIESTVVREMETQLRKFYKNFVEREEATDVRALRAEKNSSFTTGFQRDVGSSFFYDYGAVTTPEIRSLGIDSTNFHLVRFVRSLDSTLAEYDRALAEYTQLTGEQARMKFIKERRPDFLSGNDFRDFERLQDDRSNIKFLRDNISTAYGGHQIRNIEMFSKAGRLSGDFISSALTGLLTSAKIFVGSAVKMGMVLGRINRFYMGAYVRGAVSTMMSLTGMTARTAIRVPGQVIKAYREGWNDSVLTALARGIETSIEGFFQSGKYFNQQYEYGLGFKSPAGFRAYNILTDPYSHGGGYDPKLSRLALIRLGQKAWWRTLSLAEAPLEIIKAAFPQMAYAVSYDAAARTAGWTIDGIAAQARRSYEFLEKTGGISAYDLNNPSSLKNVLPANYVLPRFLIKKGQTELYQARDWWHRAIDIGLNETVLNYWRKLSQTPKDKRGDVSFLASEFDDPAQAKLMEERRAGGLMSILLKDVHHAAVENRPIQFRMDSTWRFMFPLLGWTSHSVRSTLQALGRSPTDPRTQTALWVMSAATLLGFVSGTILLGEGEKDLKKVIKEVAYGEEYPEKMLTEADSGTELGKLMALDAVAWIPQVHNIAANLLGESSQSVNESGISIFTIEKMSSLLRYVKGVIATGEASYGLPGLVKSMLPFGRFMVNQLDSQQGLIELKNVRTIVEKHGPQDMVEGKGPIQYHEPTELTPFKNRLSNAIYKGDAAEVAQAGQDFIAKAESMGQTPDKARQTLNQVMATINPFMISGRKMTEEQRQEFISKLGSREAGRISAAEENWTAALNSFGFTTPLTKTKGLGGSGGSGGGSGYSGLPAGRSSTRNRLRMSRGRSRGVGRIRGMRAPRLRLSRQRFRGGRNRVRQRRSNQSVR